MVFQVTSNIHNLPLLALLSRGILQHIGNVNAPVLLRPVRLSSATAEASLTLDPSIELNPLGPALAQGYGFVPF